MIEGITGFLLPSKPDLPTISKSICILLVIIATLILNCDGVERNDFRLEIVAVSAISDGEHVDVKVMFHNGSKESKVIYYWSSKKTIGAAIDCWLFFKIYKDESEVLCYSHIGPSPHMPHSSDNILLEPGDKYEEILNLTRYYVDCDRVNEVNEALWPNALWSPGRYRIQCTYKYIHNENWVGGKTLWQGELTSNEIVIIVE